MQWIFVLLLLAACKVGEDYKRPDISQMVPEKFKEAGIDWNLAKPNADFNRGHWWKVFNDSVLNHLIDELNINNQNIIAAEYNYKASLALIEKARSSYFPNLGINSAITKQRELGANSKYKNISSHEYNLASSWEIDLWGSIASNVEQNKADANKSKAALALAKLSAQSSLAQYYFELRMADKDQEFLDNIVNANQKLTEYIANRIKAGLSTESDLLNARNNLQTAKANALNNNTVRSQYEHAIAVLMGNNPSSFTLKPLQNHSLSNISIPDIIPSSLLERRPDIAEAEQSVIQANAQIGMAKAAFFPGINFNTSEVRSGDGLGKLLSVPNLTWAVGPQIALGLFDGGARDAQLKFSKASYEASIASYKQVILSAFSEIEDNLIAVKDLEKQAILQNNNVTNNSKTLSYIKNQYKAGTVDYSQVLNSEINLYNSKKIANDTEGLKRVTEITLIKSLGGGWNGE